MDIAEWHLGTRRPTIGVMGGDVSCDELTKPLGRLIATRGWNLLTGGGEGVMSSVASAFQSTPHEGVSIGIIRGKATETPARTYAPNKKPNPYVDIAIFTHLPDSGSDGKLRTSRNHINVLSSHVVVGLPGGGGTESEIQLAMEYQVPLVLLLGQHTVNKQTAKQLVAGYSNARVTIATVGTLEAAIAAYLR